MWYPEYLYPCDFSVQQDSDGKIGKDEESADGAEAEAGELPSCVLLSVLISALVTSEAAVLLSWTLQILLC